MFFKGLSFAFIAKKCYCRIMDFTGKKTIDYLVLRHEAPACVFACTCAWVYVLIGVN